ncbi:MULTISPECIES: ExbD/TolR family protein [Aminobacterium]|jgi:biopolymer transport protein ExbD|uniref:Biopolymer transport protein ExbD/TolR n=1 Tax=Aminobacterium colombiense (strain DSM 12261 / ALA-1) TaxID=572547 RepID=D5ED49_AMICL|nr:MULTISPECIES: biopolymer transporter ExbD [Aminobacterium]MDD2378779.1 biopolymer transporter ExbD [Aminobacterium colombiense]ADE56481.1 Biopolymer transport protein ExbD/TolR [Aminobacterium colombiense DSM 12261]MDD3767341.1 biopolymer transporter ExbD [Aminobacterium colombiense]MDD4265152.1 biopolymer transporter ExbD [Aminobacterium colombiense]MDD4585358.1 biopolymer transporter ExbD [Aminobacterium colombiense]
MASRPTRSKLPEIDITPLVDILFILIIFFVLTTTFGQSQLQVQLPQGKADALESDQDIYITLKIDGTLLWENEPISEEKLALRAIEAEKNNRTILLAADREVPYGTVAAFLSRLHEKGLIQIALMLQEE